MKKVGIGIWVVLAFLFLTACGNKITTEDLYELNGIDPNNYMLYPGDTLRVK